MQKIPENSLENASGKTRNTTPVISVIIPVFNREAFIKKAVESVLDQDYSPIECIVVDDGSTDRTPQILSGFGDRIRVIQQENSGVSAARNTGIRAASGELIAFLDSDDYWLSGKVRALAAFFEAHPDALLCQTDEIWIRNGRRVNPGKRHKKLFGQIFAPSLELCLISPSAVMMRRSLFDKIGFFDETFFACEDYDLWLRVTCQHEVHLIETPMIVKQGGHQDQLSAAPGLDRYRIAAIDKIMKSGKLSPEQFEAAAMVLARKCRIYAKGCARRGREEDAAYYLGIASLAFGVSNELHN